MPPASAATLADKVAANRQGIDVYVDLARNLDTDRWVTPVKPGAWSPAQITAHVTKVYDFGTAVIDGSVGGRPLPGFLRWLMGRFWFRPVVKTGRFSGKVKAPKQFLPHDAEGIPTDLLARLRAASERFASAVESHLAKGQETVAHPMFGTISLLDFLELQVIHVRHHGAQLPRTSS